MQIGSVVCGNCLRACFTVRKEAVRRVGHDRTVRLGSVAVEPGRNDDNLEQTQRNHRITEHLQASSSGMHADRQLCAGEFLPHQELLSLLRSKRREAGGAPGMVYLVGTGPGDPGLLTLRALQLMQSADVVLYDRLVSEDILSLVHGGARMVYVGKAAGFHTRSQADIHELLCAFAETGASVLRLKGGDPFVFGRGGEEVQYLAARGVRVAVVPGITAASGICAELGIPLTHRGVASSVRFLTGHSREGGQEDLDEAVRGAGDAHTTLVVYMGLQTLPLLIAQLVQAGLDPLTPAVAVERGTTPQQRVVFNPVHGLQAAVQEAGLKSPTLMVIGHVVSLSPGWRLYELQGLELQRPMMDWVEFWGGPQPLPLLVNLVDRDSSAGEMVVGG